MYSASDSKFYLTFQMTVMRQNYYWWQEIHSLVTWPSSQMHKQVNEFLCTSENYEQTCDKFKMTTKRPVISSNSGTILLLAGLFWCLDIGFGVKLSNGFLVKYVHCSELQDCVVVICPQYTYITCFVSWKLMHL